MIKLFRVTFWDCTGHYDLMGYTVVEIRQRVRECLPSRAAQVRTITAIRGEYAAQGAVWE